MPDVIFHRNTLLEHMDDVEELREFVRELVRQQKEDTAIILRLAMAHEKLRLGASYGMLRVGLDVSKTGQQNEEPITDKKTPTDV